MEGQLPRRRVPSPTAAVPGGDWGLGPTRGGGVSSRYLSASGAAALACSARSSSARVVAEAVSRVRHARALGMRASSIPRRIRRTQRMERSPVREHHSTHIASSSHRTPTSRNHALNGSTPICPAIRCRCYADPLHGAMRTCCAVRVSVARTPHRFITTRIRGEMQAVHSSARVAVTPSNTCLPRPRSPNARAIRRIARTTTGALPVPPFPRLSPTSPGYETLAKERCHSP